MDARERYTVTEEQRYDVIPPSRRTLFPTARSTMVATSPFGDDGAESRGSMAAPGQRRLLKGGTGSSTHAFYGSSMSRPHTAISHPWAGEAVARTPYGMTARHVVVTSTVVMLMHNHHGYGRYYEDDDGCYSVRGCPVKVAEPLSRDVLQQSFAFSESLAFPLSLQLTVCNVTRAAEGVPSVFFSLYSEGSELTAGHHIGWLGWMGILFLAFCLWHLLVRSTAIPPAGDLRTSRCSRTGGAARQWRASFNSPSPEASPRVVVGHFVSEQAVLGQSQPPTWRRQGGHVQL